MEISEDSFDGESDGAVNSSGPDGVTSTDPDVTSGEPSGSFTDDTFPPDAGEGRFSFSYSLSETPKRGDRMVHIGATATNVGTGDYVAEGGFIEPTVTLFSVTGDGTRYEIRIADRVIPEPVGPLTLASGESSGCTFVYDIPEDAPSGRYDLRISFEGDSQIFEGVFTLED